MTVTGPGFAAGIADPTVPLPHIPPDPTLDQIADFLQVYGAMEVDTLAAAITARYPRLRFDGKAKHAIVSGWLRPQMEHAAFALRQFSESESLRAIRRSA